jgi:hypothetical protein
VAEHGEDAIARIGDVEVTSAMELVNEAEAIGVAASHRRRDEALEGILDEVGLDIKVLAQVVIVSEFLANDVHVLPVDLCVAPEERYGCLGPDLLYYPRAGELE